MSAKSTTCVLLIVVIASGIPDMVHTNEMYLTSISFDSNPVYMEHFEMSLGSDNGSLNIVAHVRTNLSQSPWLGLNIEMNNRTLLKYDINVCQFLGKGRGRLFASWLDTFWKSGNMPKCCPIQKGNYSWTNFRIERAQIPLQMPSNKYRILVNIYLKRRFTKETVVKTSSMLEFK